MACVLSVPHFHDEAAAYEFVEARVWLNGPFCPRCGEAERINQIAPNPEKKVRLGPHKCGSCWKQFTVKVGTVFHRYLAEFDFRYNNRAACGVSDSERAGRALAGIKGKRRTYRGSR